VCGWVNLRSHLAISFNQNQYKNVCVVSLWRVTYPKWRWSYYDGRPTQIQNGLIVTGDLPKCKMISLQRVTYPNATGDLPKCKMVSLWWVTYPSGKREEWSHSDGWPTQVKKNREWSHFNRWPTQVKKIENGLILMGDLPRKNDGLIVMGDLPKWKRGRLVSLWWVTYPGGRMTSL
jgi:hypothetical protein